MTILFFVSSNCAFALRKQQAWEETTTVEGISGDLRPVASSSPLKAAKRLVEAKQSGTLTDQALRKEANNFEINPELPISYYFFSLISAIRDANSSSDTEQAEEIITSLVDERCLAIADYLTAEAENKGLETETPQLLRRIKGDLTANLYTLDDIVAVVSEMNKSKPESKYINPIILALWRGYKDVLLPPIPPEPASQPRPVQTSQVQVKDWDYARKAASALVDAGENKGQTAEAVSQIKQELKDGRYTKYSLIAAILFEAEGRDNVNTARIFNDVIFAGGLLSVEEVSEFLVDDFRAGHKAGKLNETIAADLVIFSHRPQLLSGILKAISKISDPKAASEIRDAFSSTYLMDERRRLEAADIPAKVASHPVPFALLSPPTSGELGPYWIANSYVQTVKQEISGVKEDNDLIQMCTAIANLTVTQYLNDRRSVPAVSRYPFSEIVKLADEQIESDLQLSPRREQIIQALEDAFYAKLAEELLDLLADKKDLLNRAAVDIVDMLLQGEELGYTSPVARLRDTIESEAEIPAAARRVNKLLGDLEIEKLNTIVAPRIQDTGLKPSPSFSELSYPEIKDFVDPDLIPNSREEALMDFCSKKPSGEERDDRLVIIILPEALLNDTIIGWREALAYLQERQTTTGEVQFTIIVPVADATVGQNIQMLNLPGVVVRVDSNFKGKSLIEITELLRSAKSGIAGVQGKESIGIVYTPTVGLGDRQVDTLEKFQPFYVAVPAAVSSGRNEVISAFLVLEDLAKRMAGKDPQKVKIILPISLPEDIYKELNLYFEKMKDLHSRV